MSAITINDTRIENFSFKYVVGFDLINYLHDGELQILYCDPTVTKPQIVQTINLREEGLEHLVRKIMRWKCTNMEIIIPAS